MLAHVQFRITRERDAPDSAGGCLASAGAARRCAGPMGIVFEPTRGGT
jgi:hypothetical protein